MASQTQGIQQLLAAEKRAAEKVRLSMSDANSVGLFILDPVFWMDRDILDSDTTSD
jgi:hypothetical protein